MGKELKVQLEGVLENQSLARAIAAAYVAEMDPTVDELTEIKTAVSEAFSNAALHGYQGETDENVKKPVYMEFSTISDDTVMIKVEDKGKGIEDIAKAMEPLFTTDTGNNRSGMGFTVMESFTDKLKVDSRPGEGTTITMIKKLDTYYGF
ncbi:MAG: anti-sigma F factor [Firmicutes bacterium]|jgi:stage II sporulation protein AB (anti-sigma F factor)|nr:anti-sigma F factor [Bacillota bacterium]